MNGELPAEEASSIDRHLGLCSECRDRADEASSDIVVRLFEETLISAGYDEAFDRAVSRAARTLTGLLEEARGAEALLADLLREPSPMRRRRIQTEERFQIFELSQLLRLRSRDARFSDHATTLEMADLAVEVALHLDSERYGSSLVEGNRALAWGHLANAWRINSDFWKAEAAVRQAWLHHFQAGQDTYTETELLRLTASLRSSQGWDEEAVRICNQAIAIYQDVRDSHLEGVVQIQKGMFLGCQGLDRKAIPVLRVGLRRIDASIEPHLLLQGKHNLMASLTRTGPPETARKHLEENRTLYQGVGYPSDLIRLRWLEAAIARADGELAEAETTLWEVRESFLDLGMGSEVFFASLELAELCSLTGKRQRAREVLAETIPLGEALGLRKETLAARLLYERAV